MTFAGNEHDIARMRLRYRTFDRRAAIQVDFEGMFAANAACNVGSDSGRFLGAWIIACNVRSIADRRSDAAHFRALTAIPIAAASEHHGELMRRRFTQCRKGAFERVGSMGVIDDNVDIRCADVFHPSRNALERREPVRARCVV